MEAFQLLARGGTKFDKNRFQNDVRLFRNTKAANSGDKILHNSQAAPLPVELDFFKYAQGTTVKRKSLDQSTPQDGKRRKMDDGVPIRHSYDSKIDYEQPRSSAMTRHKVVVKGSNIPEQINSFQDLKDRYKVAPRIISNLSRHGFVEPTSIQSYAIPILLNSRDLAAISPTGTGKTISYLCPILCALEAPISDLENNSSAGVRAVIVAPTRELAHQIHNECLKLAQGRKWRIVLLSKATANTLSSKDARDKVDIIISTPLRLVGLLQSGNIGLDNVRHLVLDEADRLLDAEFLPQIKEILAACTHSSVQYSVFSATLPAGVEKMALEILQDPIRVVVGLKDTPLPLISQSLTYVADDSSKLPSLLTYLSQPYNPPLIIFASSQVRAASLAEELVLNGISNVDCLHAGMSNKEREEVTSRMRNGECWIMVSTEVMARGMDFKGVREVINYDFPTSVQSYIHRIGRTGRAGREGKSVTYFTDDDAPYLKSIANVILQSGSTVPDWILRLPKPSKLVKKTMGRAKLPEMVNKARKIGRRDAIKKREMIVASKRRSIKGVKAVPVDTLT